MLRTHYTKDIGPELDGEKVVLAGWVRAVRELGSLKFIIIADMHGECQITAKKGDVSEEIFAKINSFGKEDVITIEGRVKKNEKASRGAEIIPENFATLSKAASPLPLDFKVKAGIDKRLDWRSLDLRKPEIMAIFKIESAVVQGMEEWMHNNDFVKCFTPCIMGVTSEGRADVFPVIYFMKEAFLRQDPQLHRQLVVAGGIDRMYDIGSNWRADPSHTSRHLCEHRGCAVEIGFISDEYDVMRIEEKVVAAGFEKAQKECSHELGVLEKQITIPKIPFPVLEFPKVYEILAEMGKQVEYGDDIDREAEMLLGEYVKNKFKHDFLFLNRFPFSKKPFYVMRYDDEPEWARSTDMICRGTELSSGGQREHRYDRILKQAKEKQMTLESVKWFTDHFKYGVPPHGGFCIGIERIVMKMLGLDNIKEAVLFPRTPERLVP
ncbi:MAG: aspartate--tRNA(Asn) ligase [Candidatus Aenigmarchaeota archaeon]|nr:aspartate--tRNA(Asn) ligase [Candidatus Aenigmarchaeota archaeon]